MLQEVQPQGEQTRGAESVATLSNLLPMVTQTLEKNAHIFRFIKGFRFRLISKKYNKNKLPSFL